MQKQNVQRYSVNKQHKTSAEYIPK